MGQFDVRAVQPERISQLLRWLHDQASDHELSVLQTEYEFRRHRCWMPAPIEIVHSSRTVAAFYITCLPGELSMLGAIRAESGWEQVVAEALRGQFLSVRSRYPGGVIQAVLPQSDSVGQAIVPAAGLRPLTSIDQLWYRPSQVLTQSSSDINAKSQKATPTCLHWLPASEISLSRLTGLVGQTFQDTLDCPELNTVRTNRQVVQSFLMGRSLRSCPNWHVAFYHDRLVGCLLLHQHTPELVELVYMGLLPEARGRGWGKEMIQKALDYVQSSGSQILVLAADTRNLPAMKTYLQSGFQVNQRLQVYWWPS